MSSTRELDPLDIERDIPTTPEDVDALRRSSREPGGQCADLVPLLHRLTEAARSLGVRPSRDTSEGWSPFELE